MKIGLMALGLIVAGSIAALAMSQVTEDEEIFGWNYKMTVTVDTPEGEVSGSAVRSMGNGRKTSFPPEASNYGEVSGEAVVVDLGKRGVVFALISHQSDSRFYYTFPVPEGAPETPRGYAYYDSLPAGTKAVMPLSFAYPKFVTFTDLDDPKSVTLVYERGNCKEAEPLPKECDANPKGSFEKVNRFKELFGEGVSLKDITLEITDEPIIWGKVDEFLPWLESLRKKKARLNGNTSIAVMTNELADNIGPGSFSRGEKE